MASFLAGGRGLFCSFDSARGRFNDFASEEFLTVGVGVPFEGVRFANLVKGFSGVVVVAGLEALVMLSFGFGALSTFSGAAGVGVEEEDGILEGSPVCSVLGVAAPDNFSRRLRRIYRWVRHFLRWRTWLSQINLIHLLFVWSFWRTWRTLLIGIHVCEAGILVVVVVEQ